MSYDLAIWDGERPASDAAALDVYIRLSEDEESTPTSKIVRYREALLQRWPDTDLAASPWATGQTGDANGSLLLINIQLDRAEEVAAYAADLAAQHGLTCYDPQQDRLRP